MSDYQSISKSEDVKKESSESIQSETTASFEGISYDFSPGTLALKSIQSAADDSPRSTTITQLQAMANASSNNKRGQLIQLQAMADARSVNLVDPIQRKENKTGLPDNLKTGMENLSGMSMDDVKVHRNSDKPAQLQAHAFAQGTDIHLGPGQEKHLPHELGHVVQQKQGRVKPTIQMKGKVNVNDDAGLEKEADVLGAKALNTKISGQQPIAKKTNSTTVQRIETLEIIGETPEEDGYIITDMKGVFFVDDLFKSKKEAEEAAKDPAKYREKIEKDKAAKGQADALAGNGRLKKRKDESKVDFAGNSGGDKDLLDSNARGIDPNDMLGFLEGDLGGYDGKGEIEDEKEIQGYFNDFLAESKKRASTTNPLETAQSTTANGADGPNVESLHDLDKSGQGTDGEEADLDIMAGGISGMLSGLSLAMNSTKALRAYKENDLIGAEFYEGKMKDAVSDAGMQAVHLLIPLFGALKQCYDHFNSARDANDKMVKLGKLKINYTNSLKGVTALLKSGTSTISYDGGKTHLKVKELMLEYYDSVVLAGWLEKKMKKKLVKSGTKAVAAGATAAASPLGLVTGTLSVGYSTLNKVYKLARGKGKRDAMAKKLIKMYKNNSTNEAVRSLMSAMDLTDAELNSKSNLAIVKDAFKSS